ncbi:MAG: polysaccharide deacetylase family protein [Chthoniobacterales bacterium]
MESLIARALSEHRVTASSVWLRRALLVWNLTPPLLVGLIGVTHLWVWLYAVVAHGLLLVALLYPRSTMLGPVLARLPTSEKIVWLTIDDGPSADTVELAKMLEAQGVSATFFLMGKKLPSFPEALAALQRHGHTAASHTQNHDLARFWIYPRWKVARELDEFESTASRMQLPLLPAFRCPAGIKNPFLHGVLRRKKLTLVGWSVRAFDGLRCDPEKSMKRILTGLEPGAILLVHEGKTDAAGSPASVEFIRELVTQIRAAGYRFAS